MQDEEGSWTISDSMSGAGGKFISIEGDAAACNHLVQYLQDNLPDGYICQLPSTGPLGQVWRQRLSTTVRFDPLEVIFGAVADAYELAERQDDTGIIWQLRFGHMVICRDYVIGLLARYAVPHQLEDWAQHLIAFLPRPALTFYLPDGLSPALMAQYDRAIALLDGSARIVTPATGSVNWAADVLALLAGE